MKTITKLLWGMISLGVCVMYKFEALGKCTMKVIDSITLGRTFNYAACSESTLCGRYNGAGTCRDYWQKEICAGATARERHCGILSNAYNNTNVKEKVALCPKGQYVDYCTTATGAKYYPVGVESYFRAGSCVTTVCKTCPNGGTTEDAVGYTIYDKGRGYGKESNYSTYGYICSDHHAVTGSGLGAVHMQVIAMECTEETKYNQYIDVNDCFLPAPVNLTDTTGMYSCTDETGTYDLSAWYN